LCGKIPNVSFEYSVPDSIEEAIRMLSSGGEEAKLLAGGQSLIPLTRVRATYFGNYRSDFQVEETLQPNALATNHRTED
jgi:hypothetical protein